jgi:AraC-like DNA-binding protein
MANKQIPSSLAFAGDFEHPRLMSGSHQHPEIEINFFLDGEVVYLMRGSMVRIPPRQMAVFWASTPHQSVKLNATHFYWFTIPLAWILQWELPQTFIKGLMDGKMLVDKPTAEDELDCARWVKDLRASNEGYQEAAELEIRARLIRLALQLSKSPKDSMFAQTISPVGSPLRVEKIARFITEHYLEDLSAAQIAKAAGLNANYASTLFHQHCGMSPTDYLILHRAYHAHRLLATTDQKIITIAFNSGFRSLSRFYATFERIFHCPPSEVRRRGYWRG